MIPKINDTPKYDLIVPSSGKKVRYRPYLVKEEKVLMTAFQSENPQHSYKAVADTILACVAEDLNVRDLTLYDVEYMFTKIRSKSAGETADMNIGCSKCKTSQPVTIDMDNVEMQSVPSSKKIDLGDGISVEVHHPKFMELVDNETLMMEKQNHLKIIQTIGSSIKKIFTDNEVVITSEEKFEDLIDFVESLSDYQFGMVRDFIEDTPKLEYKVDFKCVSCGEHNHYNIKEPEHFF